MRKLEVLLALAIDRASVSCSVRTKVRQAGEVEWGVCVT